MVCDSQVAGPAMVLTRRVSDPRKGSPAAAKEDGNGDSPPCHGFGRSIDLGNGTWQVGHV